MKPRFSLLGFCAMMGSVLSTTGCRSVDAGPVAPTGPNQSPLIRGKEPEPAPIPQKSVPAGDSSLDHKKPDQPIDQPKG